MWGNGGAAPMSGVGGPARAGSMREAPMSALVVYESMYGNTHEVADAIGRGLATECGVTLVPVGEAVPSLVDGADLLVVGGPTHVHGMSRESTRQSAITDASKGDHHLEIDPDAAGEGLREWFDHLGELRGWSAAFDTRV